MVDGQWQYVTVAAGGGGVPDYVDVDLRGAAIVLTLSDVTNSDTLEGVDPLTLFQTLPGVPSVGPVRLPVIYDTARRIIPYRQRWRFGCVSPVRGCVQMLNIDPAMYSDTHHLSVRFIPLPSIGTEPADVFVHGAAVLLRMIDYAPLGTTIDGMLVSETLRSGPGLSVAQDWLPVYDDCFRVVPYRQTFRFTNGGGAPISGSFTIVDVVPNR